MLRIRFIDGQDRQTRTAIGAGTPWLTVRVPAVEQLLAMKLCAWRDDADVSDARRLLRECTGNRESVWGRVALHLQPGRELRAKYAFDDLWRERP